MKKFLLLLITAFTVLNIYPSEVASSIRKDATQTVRLSVTTYNTVYLGVAENEVNSSIIPKSISETSFIYNPRTLNWETNSFHFYVISFVTVPLKVTLFPCGPLTNDSTSSVIEWKNTASSFPHIMTSSTPTSEEGLTLIDEKSIVHVYTNPRVYSWEVKLVVDGSSPVEAQRYTGVFTLKVEATT